MIAEKDILFCQKDMLLLGAPFVGFVQLNFDRNVTILKEMSLIAYHVHAVFLNLSPVGELA